MMNLLLVLLLSTVSAPGDELQLVRRSGGEELARSTLSRDGQKVSGIVVSATTRLSATYDLTADGLLRSYSRELRSREPDVLISRISLTESPVGYLLREESSLGGRTLVLKLSPVSVVLDGEWPEGLIPVLLDREHGFLRALDLSQARVELVEVQPRPGKARYLELPGGGVTLEVDDSGAFRRMVAPGPDRVEILPAVAVARDRATAPPAGVLETAVTLTSGKAVLRGLYTRPQKPEGKLPAVVLLADAGDRDRNDDGSGAGSHLLRDLAHELALAGTASLRYDKRGTHASEGPDEGLAGLREDARAAGAWLATCKDVDPRRIGIIGHGEGGQVAVAAATDRPDLFRSVITLGSPARDLSFTLQSRLRDRLRAENMDPEAVEEEVSSLRTALNELKGMAPEEDPGEGRRLLRDLLHLDPTDAYQRLAAPVMILYGREDPLVPRGDRSVLRSTLSLISGYTFRFHEIQNADHEFLQTGSPGGVRPGVDTTTDVARPRNPALLLFIKDHLEKTLAPPKREG